MGIVHFPGFKKKSIFATFIMFYFIILLIPLSIGSIAYVKAKVIVQEELNKAKVSMLHQIRQAVDTRLDDIYRLALEISLNQRIQGFLYAQSPLSFQKRYSVAQIIKDIAMYKSSSPFLQDIFIYYKSSDNIVGATARYEPQLFYQNIYCYEDILYDKWYQLINESHEKRYLITYVKETNKEKRKMLTFLHSLPYGRTDSYIANIMLLVDSQNLQQLLSDVKHKSDESIYVIDEENNIVFSSNRMEDKFTIKYDELPRSEGSFHSTISDQNMVISYTTSLKSSWKYVCITPTRVFMDRVNEIKKMTLNVVLASLVVGIGSAYWFAYKSYNPIKKLVDMLFKMTGTTQHEIMSEYDFIAKTVTSTLKKNWEVMDILRKQQPFLKNQCLTHLLLGRTNPQISVSRN